jgi:hypothetical protein
MATVFRRWVVSVPLVAIFPIGVRLLVRAEASLNKAEDGGRRVVFFEQLFSE